MFKNLRTIIPPPQFDDPEQARVAELLNRIIVGMIALLLVGELILAISWIISGFDLDSTAIITALSSLFFMMVLALLKFMIHRSMLTATSWVLISTLLIFAIVNVANFGGIRDSGSGVFLIVIMLGALLLDRRGSLTFTGLGILSTLVIYLLQANQVIQNQMPATISFTEWAIFAFTLLIAGVLQRNATGKLREAYIQARRNESELTQRNQELAEIRTNLEQTITQRTEALEVRTRFLEASTLITQEASSILDPQELLEKVVDLISTHFDFYHVGIFLVDEAGEWAVLKAASSLGGKQMIARGHRLRVGRQGIVGYVTGIGQVRISQSTEMDRIHTLTAELPETRAEMALPLKARGEIIGALDIQSTEAFAFTEATISVLQSLTDQIALAISNAQLYQQAQASIEEARRAYGEYNRQAWLEAQRRGSVPSYMYTTEGMRDPMRVSAAPSRPIKSPGIIEVPIRVRGQTIGTIDIAKKNPNQDWSHEEKDLLEELTDQLGIALDSARLFEETQQRAATERLVSEISTELRETLALDTVLKTAAQKVREVMGLPELTIRLAEQIEPPQHPFDPDNDANPPSHVQTTEMEE